jgi:hypothetical protein
MLYFIIFMLPTNLSMYVSRILFLKIPTYYAFKHTPRRIAPFNGEDIHKETPCVLLHPCLKAREDSKTIQELRENVKDWAYFAMISETNALELHYGAVRWCGHGRR